MYKGECGGMVEHHTPNRDVLGSISTVGNVLCPLARYFDFPEYWLKSRKWWFHPKKS